jgi:hypothetical protein
VSDPRITGARLSRRRMLHGSAVAAGLVWTAPVAQGTRLLGAPGSPAPTSTTSTTFGEPTTTTTQPQDPVTFDPVADCRPTIGGSFDVRFVVGNVPARSDVHVRVHYLTGELAPGAAVLHAGANGAGRASCKIPHVFTRAWSAAIEVTVDDDPEVVLAGVLTANRRCQPGAFVPA